MQYLAEELAGPGESLEVSPWLEGDVQSWRSVGMVETGCHLRRDTGTQLEQSHVQKPTITSKSERRNDRPIPDSWDHWKPDCHGHQAQYTGRCCHP